VKRAGPREQGSIVTRVQGKRYLLRWSRDGQRHALMVHGDYQEAQ